MKKLFNNKLMKVYIVLLCISFLAGIVSGGFAIGYSSKLTKLQKELEAAKGSDATSAIVDMLTNALAGQAQGNTEATEEEEEVLTPEEKKLQNGKTTGIVVMIVFFVLGALFSAGAITSYQYEKYLLSDKYKAKLKRLKKYEKFKKA